MLKLEMLALSGLTGEYLRCRGFVEVEMCEKRGWVKLVMEVLGMVMVGGGELCGKLGREQLEALLLSRQNMAFEQMFKHEEVRNGASGLKGCSFTYLVQHRKCSSHTQDNKVESQIMNISSSTSSFKPI